MDPRGVRYSTGAERGRGWRLEVPEDAEDLERDDPRAVRRVRRRPHAPVVDADGLAPGRRVLAQVCLGHEAPGGA